MAVAQLVAIPSRDILRRAVGTVSIFARRKDHAATFRLMLLSAAVTKDCALLLNEVLTKLKVASVPESNLTSLGARLHLLLCSSVSDKCLVDSFQMVQRRPACI